MAQGQTTQISWTEIEAECGDYRAGFVAVFRKYEGQRTDEKDKQGRTVKVTAASFARHVHVDVKTFQAWVRQACGTPTPSEAGNRDRTREEIKRMPAEQKAQLAKEIIKSLPEEEQADIRGLRPRPPELPEAERKEREAITDRVLQPLEDAVASFSAMGVIAHLEQALEDLRETRGSLDDPQAHQIRELLKLLHQELEVHEFRAEVNQ